MTKQVIKRIAQDIDQELSNNYVATQMSDLIYPGYGPDPDFDWIIEKWHLTREKLESMADTAQAFADITESHRIRLNRSWCEFQNKWANITDSLHCIYMNDQV